MSAKSGIEWTDATWNPVVGCEQVSPGCGLCYAKATHDMRHQAYREGKHVAEQYRVPFEHVQMMPARLRMPLSWRQPRRIFVNSVSDLFHEAVTDEFILQVFSTMAQAERHTFQVLTKRPERMLRWFTEYLPEACSGEAPAPVWPLRNVWLGTSVEDQKRANERIPHLLQVPAAVRFLSCEPLLGGVRIAEYLPNKLWNDIPSWRSPTIDWVIAGGESNVPRAKRWPKPMHPEWARSLRDQCATAGVPFFFKQHGDWVEKPYGELLTGHYHYTDLCVDGSHDAGGSPVVMKQVGKKRAGRQLDGRTWDEFPKAVA